MSVYLDIETTGLNTKTDRITLIGMLFVENGNVTTFQYSNIDEALDYLFSLPDDMQFITFNGRKFDFSFLKDQFDFSEPKNHLDLLNPARAVLLDPPYQHISLEKACHKMGISSSKNTSGRFMALLGKVGGCVALEEIAYHNFLDLHNIFSLHNQFRKYYGDEFINNFQKVKR